MKVLLIFASALFLIASESCSQREKDQQNRPGYENIGGMCEGCEAIHESPIPFDELGWIDTLPDFSESGQKIEISGVVFNKDGVTPAPGIVLYLYHTDQNGYYSKRGNETGWGKRHGYIRGWLKTNEKGEYKFYTLRPAPYPNSRIAAHIHPTVKEPDKNEYWIDDYVFDDDPFVSESYRKKEELRGGSGILTLRDAGNGLQTARRDLILGKNIKNYPGN